MEAVNVLRDEHQGVLIVLDQLERAVSAAETGAALPTEVFTDIQEFFVVFVDHCHHSKEERSVFPRLQRKGSFDLIQQLEAGHDRGRALSAAYAEAVRSYLPGNVPSGQKVAAAARAYAAFLREHIAEEVVELFPAMEANLTVDDAVMVEEFDRIEEEQIGPGTHERLHGMIDELPGRIDKVLA